MKTCQLVMTMLLASILASAQTKKDTLWLSLSYFVGDWRGEGGGEPGKGTYARSYAWALNKNFIEVINRSHYPAQEKNPKGEVHEDHGFISYDKALKTFVLRQFHIEGFVNEFRLESKSADGKNLVFVTNAIENIPAGWKGRETYRIISQDEFEETFELAPPGKEWSVYSRVLLQRVKR